MDTVHVYSLARSSLVGYLHQRREVVWHHNDATNLLYGCNSQCACERKTFSKSAIVEIGAVRMLLGLKYSMSYTGNSFYYLQYETFYYVLFFQFTAQQLH